MDDAQSENDLAGPMYMRHAPRTEQVVTLEGGVADVRKAVANHVFRFVGDAICCNVPIAAVAVELDFRVWSEPSDDNVRAEGDMYKYEWLPASVSSIVAAENREHLIQMAESVIDGMRNRSDGAQIRMSELVALRASNGTIQRTGGRKRRNLRCLDEDDMVNETLSPAIEDEDELA